jgi:hypothetical protein
LFGTSIVASTLSLTLHKPLILTAWLGSANVLFMLYAVVYLVGAVRKPEPARLLVAAAGTLNVAMGVRDWIAIRVSGSLADSTWIRYSSCCSAWCWAISWSPAFARPAARHMT